MLIEDYCECPKCGYKKAVTRYGSINYLLFTACPKCEFIQIDSPYPEHNTMKTKKMIFKNVRKQYLYIEKLTKFFGDKN